jgi:hypothetical protein
VGNKIVPLGGKHKTVRSLLAEVMNDEEAEKCLVFIITKEGDTRSAHLGMSRAEMAYMGLLANQMALSEDGKIDII